MIDSMLSPPAKPSTTTQTSSGAAARAADPARSTKAALMKIFSGVSRAASKSASCTRIHGTRERRAESMIIGRAAKKRGISRYRKKRLSKQFLSSRRNVREKAEGVDGILKKMAGVIT